MARADSTLVRLPQKRPVQELQHGSLFRVFNPFRVFLEFGMHSESCESRGPWPCHLKANDQ